MLQPSNRLTLIEAMRPPPGFELKEAMAVTYTLDLRALLAAPAAFALAGAAGIEANSDGREPIDLLHAVRAHADKLTVFNQVGEIALPPSRRVFAFLEGVVLPVQAPRHGVVHPKVWVLEYRPAGDGDLESTRLRVLVASRNLTFDASWDTLVRLDESEGAGGASLAPVGDLFRGLLANADHPPAGHARRVEDLALALGTARFALPPGVDEIEAHVLGLDAPASPLPGVTDRSLIISPFAGDDFFRNGRDANVTDFVSRPESLDHLTDQSRARVEHLYEFDDGSTIDLDARQSELSPRDPGQPVVGLHAKVFAFEQGNRAQVFIGSANATGAAFTSNLEILIELRGAVSNIGIDRLCEGNGDETGLRSQFLAYRPPDEPPEDEEGRALQRLRRAIADLSIVGQVESVGDDLFVRYRSTDLLPPDLGESAFCWPLASPGSRATLKTGRPLDARFGVTLETISGFLAFRIGRDGQDTEFVVPVALTDVPDGRDAALMRALIENADRFLKYLLAVMDDFGTGPEPDLMDIANGTPQGAHGSGPARLSVPVLERLLRARRSDPSKLAGLDPLVRDLDQAEALPDGFAELWSVLYDGDVGARGRP